MFPPDDCINDKKTEREILLGYHKDIEQDYGIMLQELPAIRPNPA